MCMTDPLADMLTRIRNAGMVKFGTVEMPLSKVKTGIAAILKKEGFINDYQVLDTDTQGVLRIDMKYDQNNERIITNLRRVSKPGRRIYVKHDQIPKVMSGLGIAIISTSKGIFTDKEARIMKIGGELLCEVW
ncbi:MAG: 30S ribosomal protein S8 [Deltaproteobacteria bacterium RIFOXYD12_FULL_55_16]|nr:MAG: 30S ribosomal protein S8 [Deltaproteobacteria bacterium RIFOXYD12_FULL_55_16]